MRTAALVLLVAACAPTEDDPTVAAREEEVTAVVSQVASVAGTVTVRGKVFYNNRRDHGLVAARKTPSGATGTRCDPRGHRDDGSDCSINWLGAHYAVVDVIERDEGFGSLDWNCATEEILASVTVASDGSFSATLTPTDACNHDDLPNYAIVLRARLRYCGGTTCFSLDKALGDPYKLWHPNAKPSDPLIVRVGDDVDAGNLYFNPAGSSSSVVNDTQVAANLYASLVDTMNVLHGTGVGIPTYKDQFGELQYLYPSTATSSATTFGPSLIKHSKYTEWPGGSVPAHEYGHALMLRSWGGFYGFDGIGITANDTEIAVSRQIAFKEGWAEFITRVVFSETRGCSLESFDDNATTPLAGPLGQGAQWRLNVTKALCDIYDSRDDDDAALAGAGDRYWPVDDAPIGWGPLYAVWFDLRNMWLDAADYGGNADGQGLWFCDYVGYHLYENPGSTDAFAELLYNNNIGCYLPSP